ncbi:MAG: cobalamin-dependent protein, partial [Leptospiraceae bacterium]|nr:cobalamin-dependent protein [Leptospiraceae bacterium]
RYGVQVNSLGLTEEQPENNAWRILIETLGVTMSKNARCRALQLPAWNEALSLPRPWDQQWSLRLQQILAYETDLLEYPDLFEGSKVVEAKVSDLKEKARAEIQNILDMGGAIEAIKTGYMKSQLVKSQSERLSKIMTGEITVVGRNKYTEGLPSPLLEGDDSGIFKVDTSAAEETLKLLAEIKGKRDSARALAALDKLKADARENKNLMPASIECAKAMVTTGEWSDALREIFGEYRPLTGVEGQKLTLSENSVDALRKEIEEFKEKKGYRPRFLVGKPGLDGHSNGAEMIAVAARYVGFDVIYSGIRLTPEEIAQTAIEEDVDIVGLSILSGSHKELVAQFLDLLEKNSAKGKIAITVGGIIPEGDFDELTSMGVDQIFTPKDFDLVEVMRKNLDLVKKIRS